MYLCFVHNSILMAVSDQPSTKSELCMMGSEVLNYMLLLATIVRPQRHRDAFVNARLEDTFTSLLHVCVHSTSTKPGSSTG